MGFNIKVFIIKAIWWKREEKKRKERVIDCHTNRVIPRKKGIWLFGEDCFWYDFFSSHYEKQRERTPNLSVNLGAGRLWLWRVEPRHLVILFFFRWPLLFLTTTPALIILQLWAFDFCLPQLFGFHGPSYFLLQLTAPTFNFHGSFCFVEISKPCGRFEGLY